MSEIDFYRPMDMDFVSKLMAYHKPEKDLGTDAYNAFHERLMGVDQFKLGSVEGFLKLLSEPLMAKEILFCFCRWLILHPDQRQNRHIAPLFRHCLMLAKQSMYYHPDFFWHWYRRLNREWQKVNSEFTYTI